MLAAKSSSKEKPSTASKHEIKKEKNAGTSVNRHYNPLWHGLATHPASNIAATSSKTHSPRTAKTDSTDSHKSKALAQRSNCSRGKDSDKKIPTPFPVAVTKDGQSFFSQLIQSHPNRERVLAHENVHRLQFRSGAPLGSRNQLEADARLGAETILTGQSYTPQYSAPRGMLLAYGTEDWFPNLEQQGQEEQSALNTQGLTNPDNQTNLELQTSSDTNLNNESRARYDVSVSASGSGGTIQSNTTVVLDYEPNRRVSVVGPAIVRNNPEMGLGPSDQRPAYPYILSYSRTITYTDSNGRNATVEIDSQVHISDATAASVLAGVTPSYESLLSLQGDTGYMSVSISGSSSFNAYYATYAGTGNSLRILSDTAASGLGHWGGLSLINVSRTADFIDPQLTAGEQYGSLRAYLYSADAAELARQLAELEAQDSSWFDDLTNALGQIIGGALSSLFSGLDEIASAIESLWNELPPWTRGILTAVGKFAALMGGMAVVAGLIVVALKGAVAFGTVMLVLGALALAAGFVMSYAARLSEAWNSDNRWRLLLVPIIAVLDTLGISGVIEGATNESILTGESLNRTEEEQWEAGTTGVLQLVGIFFMARGLRGSGPRSQTVTPEVRGPMQDFHMLPRERLPVLPEGHGWSRQGPEWVISREPSAPEIPLEISIYSDGQGKINYNIRSGDRVLQSEAMSRPSGDNYQGGENRLAPEIRGTGQNNPFIQEGTGVLFEKGHGIDYVHRIEGPGVRSSNADIANFTPQARYWNSFLRNHLVRGISSRGGGYREMPIYESTPSLTVNETPIPSEFIFVETSPTGQVRAAWRIPNDPAITTRRMSQLPQYSIPESQIPSVMFTEAGQMRAPGTIIGPFGVINGKRGERETN
ncbi:hypothetical protein AB6T38_12215 [Aliiglaciecola sp. SL4]|uniref:hypothetical protein n=1 Tax=Aliiglaciecola sp. SL4 TaxID=3239806 RepID=UPI00355AE793